MTSFAQKWLWLRKPRHKNRKIENVHRKDEIEQSGEKRGQNRNGRQQFPNGRAKILTTGTQEVSQKVVSDEKPSCVISNYFLPTPINNKSSEHQLIIIASIK